MNSQVDELYVMERSGYWEIIMEFDSKRPSRAKKAAVKDGKGLDEEPQL